MHAYTSKYSKFWIKKKKRKRIWEDIPERFSLLVPGPFRCTARFVACPKWTGPVICLPRPPGPLIFLHFCLTRGCPRSISAMPTHLQRLRLCCTGLWSPLPILIPTNRCCTCHFYIPLRIRAFNIWNGQYENIIYCCSILDYRWTNDNGERYSNFRMSARTIRIIFKFKRI